MTSIGRFGAWQVPRFALVALLVAIVGTSSLAFPDRAVACSCMVTGPEAIGTFADEPGVVVFTGTVTAVRPGGDDQGHLLGTIAIHEIYKGELPSSEMPVIGGGGGDCTIHIEVGQRMITAAQFESGAITPGLCMPYGDPTTPDGQRLIQEATRAYGPGRAPPGAPPVPSDPPASPNPVPTDLALPVALLIALGVTIALFALVAIAARRRSGGPM